MNKNNGNGPHRIALFADPQIMDNYSYPGRPWIVNYFTQKVLDNYHKRNWNYVQNKLDPDSTIFLGDLFDGGRNWDDEDWYVEYTRFNSIYSKKANRKTIMTLPGNHDIGFGETVNVTSLERFKTFFGPTSSVHELGNHTIVLLDTISLSDYSNEAVTKDPRQVLESLADYKTDENPRILLTHVPLYRFPDSQKCGPLRESTKKFPIMKGLQYQTVIDHELSQDILSKVRPKLVFSGDDHDYCHITHPYKYQGQDKTAEEITVKSCSMNMGIKYPAIQLLSLNNPTSSQQQDEDETYKTNICYMPQPFRAIKAYISWAIINTILFLVVFLAPYHWAIITNKINAIVSSQSNKYSLPIAEVTQTSYTPTLTQERDVLGFFINGGIVIVSVLMIFAIYFNAF